MSAMYLVTGGAGFIGSNIARELIRRGEKVRVLDNLSTGSKQNIADVADKLEFIEGDICHDATVHQAMKEVQYVLHQAALRAVARSVDDPLQTNDVNITGTLRLLVAAREAHVARFVFASSSSVYGNVVVNRNVETASPVPASPYALSKLAGEHYCRLFAELYGVPTVSLRYFNVFGPYQNPESKYSAVIPIFVNALLHGQTPQIHADGTQSRDFTFVKNVVDANLLAATVKVTPGAVFNIGNGETTSINDLYQAIQALLGTTMQPHYTDPRAGDVARTCADISKASRELGYKPRVNFHDGLATSINWYKANLPRA